MTFDELLNARKSIRKYKSTPLKEEQVNEILNSGILAPSSRNRQNLKFIIAHTADIKDRLVDACNGQIFTGEAPMFLAVCSTGGELMPNDQSPRPIDASIAMTVMIYKAAEFGIGTCWLGNFSKEKMKKLFDIPDDIEVVAVTPLGYPDESGRVRTRKKFDDIVCKEKYKA